MFVFGMLVDGTTPTRFTIGILPTPPFLSKGHGTGSSFPYFLPFEEFVLFAPISGQCRSARVKARMLEGDVMDSNGDTDVEGANGAGGAGCGGGVA